MTVYFATDHAGFELKNELLAFVRDELGYVVEDLGATELDETDDYPDYIHTAAKKVSERPDEARAIILGGSGEGEAIAANRHMRVRTAVYYGGPLDIVRLSREHNDTNMLSLGARFLDVETAKQAVALWLDTRFSGESRHARRIAKLDR
ncbi:RpiB/LacA/LacB family sugar-phosphate isomerase [Candidatus Kaiserbacteria bacterium]|nr:RpiB/LacA/LacB family sugar-phosphate isomerase [Candidatus Kaiserbacteria bacterium]